MKNKTELIWTFLKNLHNIIMVWFIALFMLAVFPISTFFIIGLIDTFEEFKELFISPLFKWEKYK